MESVSHLDKELSRLYVYAGLSSDQDTRVSAYQAMKQETLQLACNIRGRHRIYRAGNIKDRQGHDRPIRRRRAPAKGLPAVSR